MSSIDDSTGEKAFNPLEPMSKDIHVWRIFNTDIQIVSVTKGEHQIEYLFSQDTIGQLPYIYDRVKNLPNVSRTPMRDQNWVEGGLPQWLRVSFLSLEGWQWLFLFMGVFFGLLLRFIVNFLARLVILLMIRHVQLKEKSQLFFFQTLRPISYLVAILVWYFCALFLKLDGQILLIVFLSLKVLLSINLIWVAYNVVFSFCFSFD